MREIKFRGRSVETGEWVYGSLINNMFFKAETKVPVTYIVDTDQYPDYGSFEDTEFLVVEVDPETVGQYTGLKDAAGREIYEDDLGRKENTIHRVVWIKERAKFGVLVVKTDQPLIRGLTFPLEHYFDGTSPELEWIDSIWEHPHLLHKEG